MFGNDLGLSSTNKDPRSRSGVYFLWKHDRIVYIGQALCVLSRAADHCLDKSFDRSTFLRFAQRDLDFVESYLIWFLQPEINKQVPILGRMPPYHRSRISVRAKAKVLEVLESLPSQFVLQRFAEAELRDSDVRGDQSRQQKRRRLNKAMLEMFCAGKDQGVFA